MLAKATKKVVPFIDLPEQFRRLQAEIDPALAEIFKTTSFINGPAVKQFESAFAAYCQADHCVTVHNGTAALHLALLALGVGPGHEVVTVSHTFVATVEAICFAGARPIFVDVDEQTGLMAVDQLEAAISDATRAIIPVHLYGQPCDMEAINRIAATRGIPVIEDACQAHGARYQGKIVGSGFLSDIACFSFYPGKNLGAAGDGGAITTNNADLARKVKLLRDHGSSEKYHHEILGHNFRFDSIQAAILGIKLPYLDGWNQARQAHADYYDKRLQKIEGVAPLAVASGRQSVYHLYVITTERRSQIQKALKEAGIETGIHYPVPAHLQPAFKQYAPVAGSLPVSEKLAGSVLSLPMYPELTNDQLDYVCEQIAEALGA